MKRLNPGRRWLGVVRLLAVLFLPLLAWMNLSEFLAQSDFGGGADFRKFHLSGQRANAGLSPYWPAPSRGNPDEACGLDGAEANTPPDLPALREPLEPPACTHPNLNPPPFAALARVLAWLPVKAAWWCWWFGSMLAGLLALRVFARLNGGDRPVDPLAYGLLVAGFLAYFPVSVDLELGQVATLLLLPTLLAWRAMRCGHTARAGAWLGLCAALKPFFLLFLLALGALRASRAMLSFTGVLTAMLLLGGLLTSFEAYRDYLGMASGVTWTTTSWNASVAGFFARLFGGGEAAPVLAAPWVGRALTVGASLLFFGMVLRRVAVERSGSSVQQADALFAATLPAMLLVSPLGWVYYFPLLLPAVWFVWQATRDRPRARLVLIGAVLPTCIPSGLSSAVQPMDPSHALWTDALYFWCLLTLFMLVFFIRRPDPIRARHAAVVDDDRGNIRPSTEQTPDSP